MGAPSYRDPPNSGSLPPNGVFLLDSNLMAFGDSATTIDDPSGVVAATFTSAEDLFGYVVSSAGDVDRDGGEDIWIGAGDQACLLYGGVSP